MRDWQNKVKDFHRLLGGAVGRVPCLQDEDMRVSLIAEESSETIAAIKRRDLVGAIDGLCDLIYVCLGSAVAWGIDLEPYFEAVHEANMAKLGGERRADGKFLKPPGWQPPDLDKILEWQVLQSRDRLHSDNE